MVEAPRPCNVQPRMKNPTIRRLIVGVTYTNGSENFFSSSVTGRAMRS